MPFELASFAIEEFSDLIRNRGSSSPQWLIDMDISLCDAPRSMAQERRDCQFGIAQSSSYARKRVSQNVRRDIVEVRSLTNTVKDSNESHEMTITPVRREKIPRSRIGLRLEQFDGRRPDDTALCARLRRREVDGVLLFE